MTSTLIIDNILPYTQAVSSAGQTVFSTTWTADVASDIDVYVRADGVPADDATQLVSPDDYNVDFVGAERIVRVTFLVGLAENDVVTITRLTPADRQNLYTNSNFTPSMLNGDFGRVVLIMQQNQLYWSQIQPRYYTNETVVQVRDNRLPLLPPRHAWRMNAAHTHIETFAVPDGGFAPAEATYILQEPNLFLPNAQALNALSDGIMYNTGATGVVGVRTIEGTENQIDVNNGTGAGGNPTIGIASNPIIPGSEGMGIPTGTTAQRVVPGSPDISLRFNTDLDYVEYYDHNEADWQQLATAQDVLDLIARLAAHTNGDGASMIGLEDLGSVSDKTVQDLAQATFLAQTDNGTLTNAQFMADLDTGITKNTTATGVQSVLAGSSGINAVINDDTMAAATANNLSTSIAIKNYIDNLDGGSVKSVTGTANEINVDNTDPQNPLLSLPNTLVMPGTVGVSIPVGDTAERVTPTAPNISMRFNTDTDAIEYYDHPSAMWVSLPSSETGIYLEIAGGTMAGDIDMDNANMVTNLPLPVNDFDAVNKIYVDTFAEGLTVKAAVETASTANFDATYDNGVDGVGATLTAIANGAFTQDGEVGVLGKRYLIKDQTPATENGIYVITQVGDAGLPAILTRSDDFDQPDNIVRGSLVPVIAGTVNGGTKWVQTSDVDVVGTDSIDFTLWMINVNRIVTTDTNQTITGEKTFDADVRLGNNATITLNSTTAVDEILDEDNMASDSATALATQQSIKAYVDALASQIVQYSIETTTTAVTTTSVVPTYVSTGLSASITPTDANNLIVIMLYGEGRARFATPGSGTPSNTRVSQFRIYRTSGTPTEILTSALGRIFTSGASNLGGEDFGSVSLIGQEVAGTTSPMNYDIQFAARHAGTEAEFATGITNATLILMELKV